MPGSQESCDDGRRVQLPLVNRAEHTGEDLVGVRASTRAIAATDFARHDGGPQRVFGSPVRRVNGRVEQEGEGPRALVREMMGKGARDARPAGLVDERIESIDEMSARDGNAVRRDGAGTPAVAHRESLLDQRGDGGGEAVLVVIADKIAAATQQMGHTRLIDRAREAAIRRPAVADQDAGEVGAQNGGGFLKAAAALNRIDGRVRRHERPQPVQVTADPPSRLVGRDDRTAPDRLTQSGVGRRRLARRPMQRMDQAAGRDVQAEALAEERRDLPQGQAELRMQDRREGDGLRAELRGGGAERIRRLQRMAALDAAMTCRTVANRDRERPDDRPNDREIFLVLDSLVRVDQPAAAVGARGGQRRVISLVDVSRDAAMRLAAIGATGLAARPTRRAARVTARERRGLPKRRAPRQIEVIFEPLDLLAQRIAFLTIPIPILIRAFVLASEPLDFALLSLQLLDQLVARRRAPFGPEHVSVMPRFGREYKLKLRRSRRSDSESERITR
jgi:hypothetical protein